MEEGVHKQLNRREIITGSLLFGGLALLGGCATSRSGGASRLPGPLWPDQVITNRPTPQPMPGKPDPANGLSGVITRRSWTSSGPIMSLINPMNGISRITVHHDAMNSAGIRSKADAAERMNDIRRAHLNRGWADIGYHYVIDPAGRIWEGRSTRFQGAHVQDTNEHNLGIMVMGNFDEQRPTSAALATLDAFVADRMKAYRVPLSRVYTHQELKPTACPGRSLQAYMLDTRSRTGRLAQA